MDVIQDIYDSCDEAIDILISSLNNLQNSEMIGYTVQEKAKMIREFNIALRNISFIQTDILITQNRIKKGF